VPGGSNPTVPDGPTGTTPPSVSGVPTEVLGATTIPAELASVPVAGDTPVPVASSGVGDPPRVAGLALTGTSIAVLVVSGLLLLLAGVAARVVQRIATRRRGA
jgi:type IV secretory pathway VirB3-like protein